LRTKSKIFTRTLGIIGWLARYLGWLTLTATLTLSGATLLMLAKDWTLKSLATSMMAWPVLGLAIFIAVPMAFLGVGRLYFLTALGGALLYNLVLFLS
jgi:hypothetical protein